MALTSSETGKVKGDASTEVATDGRVGPSKVGLNAIASEVLVDCRDTNAEQSTVSATPAPQERALEALAA